MPETNKHKETDAEEKIHISRIAKNYGDLLRNKIFISYVAIIIFGFSSQLLYLSISPFILQTYLHISADEYGRLMMLPAIAYMIGNYISIRLNQFIHYSQIMSIGIIISLLGGVALSIISLFQSESIVSVVSCITIVILGYGFIASNAVTGAISPFKYIAGAASSLLGLLQMVGSSLFVAVVSFFFNSTSFILGASFIIVSTLMLIFASTILNAKHHQ